MSNDLEQELKWAVQRYTQGQSPDAICASLGRSRNWLYKWAVRAASGNPDWFREQSRQPHSHPLRTPAEVESIVTALRLRLDVAVSAIMYQRCQ